MVLQGKHVLYNIIHCDTYQIPEIVTYDHMALLPLARPKSGQHPSSQRRGIWTRFMKGLGVRHGTQVSSNTKLQVFCYVRFSLTTQSFYRQNALTGAFLQSFCHTSTAFWRCPQFQDISPTWLPLTACHWTQFFKVVPNGFSIFPTHNILLSNRILSKPECCPTRSCNSPVVYCIQVFQSVSLVAWFLLNLLV